MSGVQLALPPRGALQANDAHDPLPYYYHRWIGWLYRHRLQLGLNLLPEGGKRVLEIGVGSGVLVPTLTARYAEYTGTDLTLARGLDGLVAPSCAATFRQADLLKDDDLPADHFDTVVCFSVLEHIADAEGAARGLARALAPGGTLVAGYPMVSPLMTRLFRAIGFGTINEHHVSAPSAIATALARVLRPARRAAFPPGAPRDLALYQCTSWTKPPR
ncbi:MAG TPA: methyltransferase domain-containing protein [Polyangia bacterium]|nr:methyltransferase domain-containing protein [Polyangia bacterium]